MWQQIPPSRNSYRWRLSTSGVSVLDRVVEVGVLERRARAADRTRPRRALTPWQLYDL
jgi:hypothetical protein